MAGNAEESKWMGRIAREGCICCRIQLGTHEATTVHHITSGGRRLGHLFTIPLCPWHHQGYCKQGMTSTKMAAVFGPSLAKSKTEFERIFGTELELLEKVRQCLGFQPKNA